MPLWLLLAPRIADVAISCGVQEVKNLGPEENVGNFWKTRTGRTGGGRADCGGRADGRRTGGQADLGQRRGGREADGQTGRQADLGQRRGGRVDGTKNGGGRADEQTGCEQGELAVEQTGGRARGLKGPAPRSPLHSQAPRLLASLQSEFAGRLGVHWGPS